jgi:serine/threonine protein kinase/predicted Zn-dependent protease
LIGKTISHYKIIEKLGEGGMGVVYKAEDTKLKRTVALKFLSSQSLGTSEEKTRFVNEAQAAAALDHPNICTVYEIDEADGHTFIAMAYVDGQSLREKTESGPLKLEDALSLAIDIARGLQEAHEKGIVHRDIKSANIMVTKRGHAKITDFGLAKLVGTTQVTQTGTTVGTVAYMSPEQAQGGNVDDRSDIWSLGVVLYEMITGRFPFRGEHAQAVTYQIVHEGAEPVTAIRTGVPIELERIVGKCLEKKPTDRYQHVDELLVDLRKVGKTPEVKPKKNVIKYAIPGSAIFLALALFLIFKPFTFEVSPEQKAVAAENSLAIMYFKNLVDRDDPQRLGEIVTDLLITDLSESRYMRVFSSQRLYDILKLQRKEGAKDLDETTATEVATHAGAKWMLTGKILQVDPNFVINAQLADVQNGSIVASQRIEGEPGESIFTVVDKLAAEAKRDLSLPERAQKEPDVRVADITTHSIEAYRYYIEGMENLNRYYGKEAKASFEKALAYDSAFAMAYVRLLDVPGTEAEKIPWREKAVLYSASASKKEQLYIVSESAAFSGHDAKAIKGYETIIDLYPDEKRAYSKLGVLYWGMGNLERALENTSKVIEIDPLDKLAYNSLAYLYDRLGDFEKSIWAINQYIALAPDEANPYDTRGDLYAYYGKIDEAIDSYQKALERKPDFGGSLEKVGHMYLFRQDYAKAETFYRKLMESTDENERGWARYCVALIPLHEGKWDRSLEVLNQGISADELEGFQGWGYWWKLSCKADIYFEKNDLEQAISVYEKLLQGYEKAYPENPAAGGFADVYIYSLVEEEEFARATEVANAMNRGIGDDSWQYWFRKGCLEQGSGNMDAACTSFEKAAEYWGKAFALRYYMALAYQKAGRLAEAVDECERLLERFDASRAIIPMNAVRVYYHLGVAYEESGWNNKAIEQYEKFLDVWKDADPWIEEAQDAKQRLTALKEM